MTKKKSPNPETEVPGLGLERNACAAVPGLGLKCELVVGTNATLGPRFPRGDRPESQAQA